MNPQAQIPSVCRVSYIVDGKEVGGGSGFHYGGGWVITNSHVVGPRAELLPTCRFSFGNDAQVFEPKPRVCFFSRIRPEGPLADLKTVDVAFVMLSEVHRGNVNLPSITYGNHWVPVEAEDPHDDLIVQNLATYCLHFGWGEPPARPPGIILSNNERLADVTRGRVPNSSLTQNPVLFWRDGGNTSGGSSGAPVFSAADGRLIGVHFAGGQDRGVAVAFESSIRPILGYLVQHIAAVTRLSDAVDLASRLITAPHLRQSIFETQIEPTLSTLTNLALHDLDVVIPL